MKYVDLVMAVCLMVPGSFQAQQPLSLHAVLDSIEKANPLLKMYDNEIR